jgi:hypothetical protein
MNGDLRIYPTSGYVVVVLANLDPPVASGSPITPTLGFRSTNSHVHRSTPVRGKLVEYRDPLRGRAQAPRSILCGRCEP